MSNQRKKIAYNMVSGLLSRFIIIFIGLIFPKLYIETFGSETNGLVASINQIFSYLLLLEAGVGVATLQSLYKPVSEKKVAEVNSILSASKGYYNKISIFYFLGVLIVAFIYPLTISSSLSNIQIALITLSTGLASFIRFQNFQVRLNLLKAEGKEYVVNFFLNGTNIFIYIFKIILLTNGFSIVIVQSIEFIITFAQSILLNIYFKMEYKEIDFKAKPNKKSLNQSGSVMIHQISGLIFNSTDILLLTYLTNFNVVSVYTIYNTIANAVNMIATQVSNSFTFIIGHRISGDKKDFIKFFDAYELIYLSFSFTLATTMYILLTPFFTIYASGFENPDIYIDGLLAILFSLKLILLIGRAPFRQLIDTAGHFKNTRKQSIIESVINIVFTLFFIIHYNIYGALLGTIFALLYRTTDMIYYTNKYILKRSYKYNFIKWSLHIILFIIIAFININLPMDIIQVNGIISFIIIAIIVFIVILTLYILLDMIFYWSTFIRGVKAFLDRIKDR